MRTGSFLTRRRGKNLSNYEEGLSGLVGSRPSRRRKPLDEDQVGHCPKCGRPLLLLQLRDGPGWVCGCTPEQLHQLDHETAAPAEPEVTAATDRRYGAHPRLTF